MPAFRVYVVLLVNPLQWFLSYQHSGSCGLLGGSHCHVAVLDDIPPQCPDLWVNAIRSIPVWRVFEGSKLCR